MFSAFALPSVLVFVLVLLIFLGSLYVFAHCSQKKVKPFILIETILLLILFAIMRKVDSSGLGGTDAITYVREFLLMQGPLSNFIDIDKILILKQREPLYNLFAWSFRLLTDDYKLYFFAWYAVIATCFVYSCVSMISKKNRFSVVPFMMFFVCYLHSFNVMRNWLAIAVAMVGMVFLRRGSYKKYFLFLGLAFCLHYSTAVLILPFLFMFLLRFVKREKLLLVLIAIVGNIFIFSYMRIVSSLFMDTKFASYMDLQSSWLGYIPVVAIALLGIIFYEDLVKLNSQNKLVVIGCVLNVAMLVAYVKMGAYRINDCFIFFRVALLIELLSLFYQKFKGQQRFAAVSCVKCFCIVYFCQQLNVLVRTSGIIPYIIG